MLTPLGSFITFTSWPCLESTEKNERRNKNSFLSFWEFQDFCQAALNDIWFILSKCCSQLCGTLSNPAWLCSRLSYRFLHQRWLDSHNTPATHTVEHQQCLIANNNILHCLTLLTFHTFWSKVHYVCSQVSELSRKLLSNYYDRSNFPFETICHHLLPNGAAHPSTRQN